MDSIKIREEIVKVILQSGTMTYGELLLILILQIRS
jgi:hypothetical protein